MGQIKFGQKSLLQNINILISARHHFKNVDCSTPSLIFAKFDLPTKKTALKKQLGSNQIWTILMKSLIQNIKILISVTWPFQKSGLQSFSLIFAKFNPLTKRALKKKLLKVDGSNKISTKLINSHIQNIKIYISVTWPFRKFGLQYCQFNIR